MKTHEEILEQCRHDLILVKLDFASKDLIGAIQGLEYIMATLDQLKAATQHALDAQRRIEKDLTAP